MVSGLSHFKTLAEAFEHFKKLRKSYRIQYQNLQKSNIIDPQSQLLNLHYELVDLGRRLEDNGVDIQMYDEDE